MSNLAVNAITDASGGATASINGYTPSASNMTGRNRIINGDMRIDQRNAGASVTPTTGVYTLDRWRAYTNVASKFSVQQSSTAPNGFKNSTLITSLSAYSVAAGDQMIFFQKIEGFNVSDLGFGTANAATVTLSFWVRSSLTGSFGGALRNSASNRSYPFNFVINSADTFEHKTVTVVGDTSGTWLTDSGVGLEVLFSIGTGSTASGTAGAWTAGSYVSATGATSVVGTSGATFYITGVQLEVGSSASEFEHRLYGQELALCQRYFQKAAFGADWNGAYASWFAGAYALPVSMRAIPTLSNVVYPNYLDNVNTGIGVNGVTVLMISNDYIGWQMLASTTARAYGWAYGDLTSEL